MNDFPFIHIGGCINAEKLLFCKNENPLRMRILLYFALNLHHWDVKHIQISVEQPEIQFFIFKSQNDLFTPIKVHTTAQKMLFVKNPNHQQCKECRAPKNSTFK